LVLYKETGKEKSKLLTNDILDTSIMLAAVAMKATSPKKSPGEKVLTILPSMAAVAKPVSRKYCHTQTYMSMCGMCNAD
jgi:hypothetical protein